MSLRETIDRCSVRALDEGALEPIPTSSTSLDDRGVPYVVRVVASLDRKPRVLGGPGPTEEGSGGSTQSHEPPANPFLPYDPRLYVCDLAPRHVALLNKFPVIARHLLIVTREFEHQTSALTVDDFEALGRAMAELGGLGFYNGGVIAGASQPHKHLQLVPLPLEAGGPSVPFDALFRDAPRTTGPQRVGAFEWGHRFAWIDDPFGATGALDGARRLHGLYERLMDELGLWTGPTTSSEPPPPYNLLCTNRWMLIVGREREHFGPISVNALGFVGGLLARDEAELRVVERAGVRAILRTVGSPP